MVETVTSFVLSHRKTRVLTTNFTQAAGTALSVEVRAFESFTFGTTGLAMGKPINKSAYYSRSLNDREAELVAPKSFREIYFWGERPDRSSHYGVSDSLTLEKDWRREAH